MNNLSRHEFKKQAIKVLTTIVAKAYENDFYKQSRMHTDVNRAWADFLGQRTKMLININSKQIKINISDWVHIDKTFVYYEYKEDDDHYEVLNKFKNDMIKNMRQVRKMGNRSQNYKIYLYNSEYRTYENKYYERSKVNENS